MIITLICLGVLILSIIGLLCSDYFNDGIQVVVVVLFAVSILGVLICGSFIISDHINVPLQQAKIDMEYETLLNEVAYVKDLQNEPISDLTRIEYTNIAERVLDWNKRTLEAQMFGNNPWTNWFYNDAERSMKLIDY